MYPECYGFNPLYPSDADFKVGCKDDTSGLGVMTFRAFESGDLIAEFTGELLTEMTQHSLQIEPGLHLSDLYFVGYLLHSCAPNVHLDMQARRAYAIERIRPYEFLTMDYAQTEDRLFRQFPCNCGSPQCRGWITGRLEMPDEMSPLYQQLTMLRKTVA